MIPHRPDWDCCDQPVGAPIHKVKITRKNVQVVPGSEITQRTTRPIERIDEVLDTIGRVWRMYPDMRLTQLLWNLRTIAPKEYNGLDSALYTASDFYNIEENQLLDRLTEHYGVPE
jgi:hypothetical protein